MGKVVLAALVAALALTGGPGGERDALGGKRRAARRPVKAGARRVATPGERRTGAGSTSPTPEQTLAEELDAIWSGRILRPGVTAVYVVDAKSGQDVYSVHADDKLNPASNVKILSTATVLDTLGPTWSYLTRVYGASPDDRGVSRGDVYLRGSADPTFAMPHLDELAQSIAKSGVKRVEGDVILSDDLLRDTISAPRVKIIVKAGAKAGEPATVTVEPNTPYIQLHAAATTSKKRRPQLTVTTQVFDPAAAGAAPAIAAVAATAPAAATATPASGAPLPTEAYDGPRLLINVSGAIGVGKSQSYRRSVGLRSTFTGHMLRQALKTAGVDVEGRVRLAPFDVYTREATAKGWLPVELARHRSQQMKDLVARTNKRSVNWLADRLLMTVGAEVSVDRRPSLERGVDAMLRWLDGRGVSSKDVVLDTGSGLSHKTKITARHIVRVLRAAAGFTSALAPHSLLDPGVFLASLSIGGVDGTLRGRFRSDAMKGRVIGKTGTLSSSVALSGFVSDERGGTLCFAIVTNGNRWNARYRVRREQDQMVAAMKRYLDARFEHQNAAAAAVAATPAPAALTGTGETEAQADAEAEEDASMTEAEEDGEAPGAPPAP
ncbi:MAG TPA: D-alanyl-D-alanine carboxypeptidase/D-alanyl-D-alanine-endopeptidase [Kofleriaceae bacterium]|nr:D-alanyl-D-alanine carboxypeptidase/D-alanyl-D-alanine-endopeptidase [Kofleriaceae bacterium]